VRRRSRLPRAHFRGKKGSEHRRVGNIALRQAQIIVRPRVAHTRSVQQMRRSLHQSRHPMHGIFNPAQAMHDPTHRIVHLNFGTESNGAVTASVVAAPKIAA
jgi:hypothetical protein